MVKSFAPRIRFWTLALVILVGYGTIGYRLFELHVVEAPGLIEELESSRYRLIPLNSRRGDIFSYDLNGDRELFATSKTLLEVGIAPAALKKEDLVKLPQLARLMGLDLARVETVFGARDGEFIGDKTTRRDRWRLLSRRIEEEHYDRILELGISGLYGTRKYERVYPKNSLASHIIGLVRHDGEAVSYTHLTLPTKRIV